jgi:anti-sigma factor RsiW
MSFLLDRLRVVRDHAWVGAHASEYLDGELGSRGRARVERHIARCHACRELLRGLERLVSALGQLRHDHGGESAAAVRGAMAVIMGDQPPGGP